MTNVPNPPPFPSAISTNTQYYRSACNLQNNDDEGFDHMVTSLHDLKKYQSVFVTKVQAVPQSGPNCGLAALGMISTLTPVHLTVNEIFVEARSRGFTNNGEIFSTQNMKILAEVLFSTWFKIELFCDGLATNKKFVVDSLYNGSLMLIAYDADKNHSPCCKKGHKAHWALICGIMIDNGEICVAARHGKSRHLAVWKLDNLEMSNENLMELDPHKLCCPNIFLIPPEGVREGLCSKFIMLQKRNM